LRKGYYVVLRDDSGDQIIFHRTCFSRKECKTPVYFVNAGCHREYLDRCSVAYTQIISYGNTVVEELCIAGRKKHYYNLQVETCTRSTC
jgi:hypothetical protein